MDTVPVCDRDCTERKSARRCEFVPQDTGAYAVVPHEVCRHDGVQQFQYAWVLLDVLTPLSDCRHESVENMERRISGVSYMCWMDFHNGILSCGVLCARLISFSFVSFFCVFSGYHAEGYHAPSITHGLSRLYHHCTATPLVSFPTITP